MSKKSNAKIEQVYDTKPVLPICSNCKHFKSDKIINEYNYVEEKNIRCGLGEFAVKKQATCNLYEKN